MPTTHTPTPKPGAKGPGRLVRTPREKWLMLFAQAVSMARERLVEASGAPKDSGASYIASARRWAKEARFYYAMALEA